MRKVLTLFVVVFFTLLAYGQDVRMQFLSIPDSLLPHFDMEKRMALLDMYDIKKNADFDAALDAGVDNRLHGVSSIDTLTTDYLKIRLNSRTTWEMKLLAAHRELADSNKVVGISVTVSGEKSESRVSVYSRNWELLCDTIFTGSNLLEKPADMAEETFRQHVSELSLVLWQANFSPDSEVLTLSPSLLFVPFDEKEKFTSLNLKKKVKWNGKSFN